MNSASEDLKDMLVAESDLGLVFATNLFIGQEPAKPSETATLFDYSVIPPQLTLDGAGIDNPSVQVRVRSTDYQKGWILAEIIKNSLHGRAQETWNGTLYSVIYCSSGPALLDWDENNRPRFIVNFNIQRRS